MRSKLLPDSLFGRLLTAMLAAIAITLVVVVALLLDERRDSLFSRSETVEVVTAIAAAAKRIAALPLAERPPELERLRRESLGVEGRPARPPGNVDDLRSSARLVRSRLERELGDGYAVGVIPARPGGDAIDVRPGRPRFDRGPPPQRGAESERDARDPPPRERFGGPDRPDGPGGRGRPGGPPRERFGGPDRPDGPGGRGRPGGPPRELDVTVTLPDGAAVVFRADAPVAPPPLPLALLLELGFVALVLGAVLFAMARTISRPLADLAAAAEAVGRGARVPLRETGARELREATHAFNVMQERLHRYLDSRTRVLSAMSHDLRTPLTRLKLRTESLDDAALRERFNADLDEMQRMVTGALGLFRGLNHDEPLQAVDVDALVAELRAELAEIGTQVAVTGAASAPLLARPTALKRCLANLLANAAKYGVNPAVVIEESADDLVVRVLDEGPGIPPEMLEQVFEPFFRLESSRNADTGGTGLGLGIARDIAQAHGGSLVLRNRSPRGLEALLRLPKSAVGR